jgi:restriction system protein
VIQRGDRVVSYDPEKREYLLGTVAGDYEHQTGVIEDCFHVRRVSWQGRVSRDALSPSSRNTLGSTLTIFEPGDEVLAELTAALGKGPVLPPGGTKVEEEEFERIRQDTLSRAHEFIKDRILKLGPTELEHLTAALLRALGYKARVTPTGPDRGRDVIASPDGLGFQSPRVMAEVKHRPGSPMGPQEVRSFVGGLREGDRGLYVSTGGFTKEARYEADRATVPVTLVDLDTLATLAVEHYANFDQEGRALLPLVQIHWPLPRR